LAFDGKKRITKGVYGGEGWRGSEGEGRIVNT